MELDHKRIKSKGKKKSSRMNFFFKKKNKNKLKEDASLYIKKKITILNPRCFSILYNYGLVFKVNIVGRGT